jgi:hypothetical protein
MSMRSESPPADQDLRTICEFEIALRNVLPWREQVRQVVDHHSGARQAAIDLAILDGALYDIGQLVTAVAALRDRLNAESSAQAELREVAGRV